MISNRSVVLLSGGMDSTALLYLLIGQGQNVYPLAVNYGQRHVRELDAALAVTDHAIANAPMIGARCEPLHVFEIPAFARLAAGSSQTSKEIPVPEGHYADPTMRTTVVPNRNMVLIALATAYAISRKAYSVAYAAHAGDHAIYPDCRPVFVHALEEAMLRCDYEKIFLRAPFLGLGKDTIVKMSQKFPLAPPFQLTYSCYKGGALHCSRCGTCVERREAFKLAGVPDPTQYEQTEVA